VGPVRLKRWLEAEGPRLLTGMDGRSKRPRPTFKKPGDVSLRPGCSQKRRNKRGSATFKPGRDGFSRRGSLVATAARGESLKGAGGAKHERGDVSHFRQCATADTAKSVDEERRTSAGRGYSGTTHFYGLSVVLGGLSVIPLRRCFSATAYAPRRRFAVARRTRDSGRAGSPPRIRALQGPGAGSYSPSSPATARTKVRFRWLWPLPFSVGAAIWTPAYPRWREGKKNANERSAT